MKFYFNLIIVLRIIDIFGFLLANYITYFIIEKFLPGNNILGYIIFFMFSLVIIKTDWILWLFEAFTKRGVKFKLFNTEIKNKRKFAKVSILIILKQTFFNTLYYLFPVCLVWLCLSGAFYLFGWVNYKPHDKFFQIITAFSILLGIFNYFLKRHEEKIAIKISQVTNRINTIIEEETNFEKFLESINDKHLKNWIARHVEPKLLLQDIISTFIKNKDAMKLLGKIMKKSRSPIQISLTYPDSQKKFEIIEIAAKVNEKQRERLTKAYKDFFLNEDTVKRITDRIEREVDLKEFGRLALSNINIVHEILPEFISFELKKAFEDILLKGREFTEDSIENLYSSKDFRNALSQKIILSIIRKWI